MVLKRRIQWINSLPEEIRQRAISRIQEQLICPDWHEEFCSLELCLGSSFVLRETIEGYAYWVDVIICTGNNPRFFEFVWYKEQDVKLLKELGWLK